jgi:hypothetical protein
VGDQLTLNASATGPWPDPAVNISDAAAALLGMSGNGRNGVMNSGISPATHSPIVPQSSSRSSRSTSRNGVSTLGRISEYAREARARRLFTADRYSREARRHVKPPDQAGWGGVRAEHVVTRGDGSATALTGGRGAARLPRDQGGSAP